MGKVLKFLFFIIWIPTSFAREKLDFDIDKLDQLIHKNKVRSVDQLIDFLPEQYKTENFTKVYFSQSLQPAPRIIMFSDQMVISINKGNAVEGMIKDPKTGIPKMFRYEFDLAQNIPNRQDNPKACTGCHGAGETAHFIFSEGDSWHGFVGSNNGAVTSLDQKGLESFGGARFTKFKGGGNVFVSGFSSYIKSANRQRLSSLIMKSIKDNPRLSAFRYAILGSVACVPAHSVLDTGKVQVFSQNDYIPKSRLERIKPSFEDQVSRTKTFYSTSKSNQKLYSDLIARYLGGESEADGSDIKDQTQRAAALRFLLEGNGINTVEWSTEFPTYSGIIGGIATLEFSLAPQILNKNLDKELIELWDNKETSRFCNALKIKSKYTLMRASDLNPKQSNSSTVEGATR